MEAAALFAPVEAARTSQEAASITKKEVAPYALVKKSVNVRCSSVVNAHGSGVVNVHGRGIDHNDAEMMRVEISALSSFSCAETRNDVEDD